MSVAHPPLLQSQACTAHYLCISTPGTTNLSKYTHD